jgi:DNA (cytosine-5)-methyltransferase 1
VNVFSVCSGIGAMDLGLQRAGMRVVAQVECDPYCMRVLDYHFPGAAKHDDIHTALDWWLGQDRPRVDVVAGGPPCQPVSLSGAGRGADDERWLWDQYLAVIDHLRPEWVVWENVPGLLTRGLDVVHRAFAELGYNHTVGVASACSVGAPHMRRRLFGVAHAPRLRRREGRARGPAGPVAIRRNVETQGVGPVAAAGRAGHWAGEPGVERLVDGPPDELAQRAVGNAVVPHVAEHLGRLIMAAAGEVAA